MQCSTCLGHTSLCRVTSSDKEELKKKEKELRRFRFIDDSVLLTTHVHYTLGLHHQVSAAKWQHHLMLFDFLLVCRLVFGFDMECNDSYQKGAYSLSYYVCPCEWQTGILQLVLNK